MSQTMETTPDQSKDPVIEHLADELELGDHLRSEFVVFAERIAASGTCKAFGTREICFDCSRFGTPICRALRDGTIYIDEQTGNTDGS